MPKPLFLGMAIATLAACAQLQMTPDLIEARESVTAIEALVPFVPGEVQEAKARLAEAQAAYERGQTDIANRHAREAIVAAQLAEARAGTQQAIAERRVLERLLDEARHPPPASARR